MKFVYFALFCFICANVFAEDVSDHLQNVSVTIKAGIGSGSGVRTFIDTDGHVKKTVEFQDAEIRKKIIEAGRTVGQLEMDAKVIKYSDAKNGEDLALLMIRKEGFVDGTVKFFYDEEEKGVALGTQLYHVGSLLGENGSNSMTTGIMSQVGRTVPLSGGGKVLFDQTTVTAFPGSSGGGVFLTDGKYVGMLVRGAGETFNLIVPVRRMRKWAEKEDVLWAMDAKIKAPTLEEIEKLTIENMGDLKEEQKIGPFIIPREKTMELID